MEPEFWHQRWRDHEIGFHAPEANPLLVKHFDALSLNPGSRVFVPLCGKTLDIGWLLSRGCRVVGIELSETAVTELFADLGITPQVTTSGALRHYRAAHIDIFVGDFFVLSGDRLGAVDAIYDRAALVALPPPMRRRYTAHLLTITARAQQLLLCFAYEQGEMDGPPFSVPDDEVRLHYRDHYELTKLASVDVPGGLKGQCAARENVWLLHCSQGRRD